MFELKDKKGICIIPLLFVYFSYASVPDGYADEAAIDYGECHSSMPTDTAVLDDTREACCQGNLFHNLIRKIFNLT